MKKLMLGVFLSILVLLIGISFVSASYYLVIDDNASVLDIAKMNDIQNYLTKNLKNYPFNDVTFNSKINREDLKKSLTLFLYNGKALIILDEGASVSDLQLAYDTAYNLENFGVPNKVITNTLIKSDNLVEAISQFEFEEPGTTTVCGNNICDKDETPENCEIDCGGTTTVCGNNICDKDETFENCNIDCGENVTVCGNGICDYNEDENICPVDCGGTTTVCGNNVCDKDETPENCGIDCGGNVTVCGNGICDYNENESICPVDCGQKCKIIGLRKEGMYCSLEEVWTEQKITAGICENNFECKSNVCVDGECISGSLIKKILDWFRRLFGG